MKKILLLPLLFAATSLQAQHEIKVTDYIVSGPFKQQKPVVLDTLDVTGKKMTITDGYSKELKFYVNNNSFTKAKLKITGVKNPTIKVDGTTAKNELNLEPGHHELTVNYTIPTLDADSVKVALDANHEIECTSSTQHNYTFNDVINGLRVNKTQVSADGKYAIIGYQNVQPGGRANAYCEIVELATGKVIRRNEPINCRWMPHSIAYTFEERVGNSRTIRRVNVLTGERTDFASDLPEGGITISPTEDYLIISQEEKAPAGDADVYLVLEPDDKMTGWRNRNNLHRYDIATKQLQRITFGYHNASLYDISKDGKKLLVGVSRSRLTKRPTTITDFLIIDSQTLMTDTLMKGAEFLNSAMFSPDGKQILFAAPAEAFGGIGRDKDAGPYSSMYDVQLFLYDIASHTPSPLTKDFNPSVQNVVWSKADGQIYISAEDRDYVNLFAINPVTRTIRKLPAKEEVISGFSIASDAPIMTYHGVSTMNPVRAYYMQLNKPNKQKNHHALVSRLLSDCATTLLKDITLGECRDFNFRSSRGDSIYGRFYLPPHFVETKKYPMIVYYYGGCSPSSRNFETRYPWNYFAAQGYVVYVVNPGGASGFGQKHSARHVNTAGKGVAEDIIEGVKAVCKQYSFVDQKHIGCIGASYGGFMTEYLQTVTDIFACAVSHAGISDHTSYWGNGNWGYNYSEVSMAEKYPWTAKDLYVDQSPLYRADKIHTPLLLTHGTADTNVPPMESMQLFTALKLLGRDVALLHVKGENHGIMDYQKRIKWQNSIMAWFEKYLKGDETWWNTLYPVRYY